MSQQSDTKRNLWMFPLGTVGRDMSYALFTNFILTYILFTRSLTAAQLSAVTAIMVAARVFDALNDPIMGNIIERTRTRFGKFKPWLAIGAVSTSFVIYFTFNTQLQGWNFIFFFGVVYFLHSITYTMHDISYWGMVAALGSDANARNQFTSRATLFAGIGGTIASMLIPMLTTGDMTIGGSASVAYGRIALIIAILSPLFLCFTIFGVREQRRAVDEKAIPISFRKIVSTITGNDQLMWIAVIFLIHQIGNGLTLAGIGSTYIYFDFGYSGGLYSLFSTIGVLATAFLMMFYPAISRRIPRKRLMRIMMACSIAGYTVMLLSTLLPSQTVRFWTVTLGYMTANFGQYSFYLVMMISIINTVEYNEYLHGERSEALIASLRPFLTKLGSAIIVAITSLSYIVFGITGITNQISSLESAASTGLITEVEKLSSINQVLGGVQPWQTRGLFLCMTVLPCLFMLASHLLYQKHYRLDEPEYNRICEELAKREEVSA
ncbi:MAG: MFS transporter [Clostridia bacterium]|nr:MFS transporter [Clostridia bacterium]